METPIIDRDAQEALVGLKVALRDVQPILANLDALARTTLGTVPSIQQMREVSHEVASEPRSSRSPGPVPQKAGAPASPRRRRVALVLDNNLPILPQLRAAVREIERRMS